MHNFSDSLDIDASRLDNSSSTDDAFSLTVSAPGKVILFGEHSVVYGKLALAASLGLRTTLTFKEHEPSEIGINKVSVNLYNINLMHCYDVEDLQNSLLSKNCQALKNITLDKPELANHESFTEIIREFIEKNRGSMPLSEAQHQALFALFYLLVVMLGPSGITLRPFSLDVYTDLAINAGLGSSASYTVCLAGVFYQLVKLKASKRNDKKGRTSSKSTTTNLSRKELDLISRWAYGAERIIHGTPSGLDNTICTLGSIVEFRKNSCLKPVELQHKFQILLVNTMVPKDTKALVAKVAKLKQSYPAIVDNILLAMENISNTALQEFLKLEEVSSSDKISLGECQEEIAEIYRRIGELVDFNQNLLRSLNVSHPLLDDICATLREVGLYGKLTGAGGGGYAFTIIPTGFNRRILEEVIEKLKKKGYETVLTDLGVPGLAFN